MTRSFASLTTLALALLAGCAAAPPELTAPQVTIAPYDLPQGEVVWAVAPLRNESGTTAMDPLVLSDKIVASVEEVRGVRCLPLNRTLETMRALKMTGIATAGDIGALASAMNVDAVLVGTVTAYDPYTPSIGISLVLWARPGSAVEGGQVGRGVDARRLQSAASEPETLRVRRTDGVVASVSEHLDGKNHQVLMDVRSYAVGRHRAADAMGWRRYLASMPLYEEFAASFAVSRLMQDEWIRLGRSVPVEGGRGAGVSAVGGGGDGGEGAVGGGSGTAPHGE